MRNHGIERLHKLIDELDASMASEFRLALGEVEQFLRDRERETERLNSAQADALVHSAEVIEELESTKSRLETARLEAEAATGQAKMLAAFGSILEESLNEIYIFDADSLRFIQVNRGARNNLGFSMAELRSMTPVDIKPEHTAESFAAVVAPLLDGSQTSLEFTTAHRRKDGTDYPVFVHLETAHLGQRKVFTAIILDITERQRIERECEESRERAFAADKAKSEFLANMSHEIRTPMTAILGYSDMLIDDSVSRQEQRNAAETIRRSGQHLLSLINEILDLSKVESGNLEIEEKPLELASVLRDVQDLVGDRAKSNGNEFSIELRGDVPRCIRTDPMRLKQALVNLTGNAAKFTENGFVRLVVDCDWATELMTFQVIDSGIGISAEQLPRIFLPFRQADSSTTRKFGGTGLGLTITKRIAELMGGDLTAESEQGKGSAFKFTIRVGALSGTQILSEWHDGVDDKAAAASNSLSSQIAGKVLVVEDGPDNQRLISFILRKAGADVTVAENGKLGVEAVVQATDEGRPFGLILMDMQMPVMDGYAATRKLRELGYEGQIAALTAHAMKDEIQRCFEAGCDAYMTKPIQRSEFLRDVAKRMGRRSRISESDSESSLWQEDEPQPVL